MPDPGTMIIIAFITGAVLGALVRHWGRSYDEEKFHNVKRNALAFSRENNEIRSAVMDFVKLRPTRAQDWHNLVDAMIHDNTPEKIRELYHRQCGTTMPEAHTSRSE